MPTEQLVVLHIGTGLMAIVAAGLLVRGRIAFCWSFFVYVLATMTVPQLVAQWPERFCDFRFYSIKETSYVVLKILIAIELWLRCFSVFPRARVRVGLLFAGVLLVTAAVARFIPSDLHPYDALIGIHLPRLQAGTLALYAIFVSAAWWYRVPVHPLHRAILVGFAAFLSVHTLTLSFLGWQGGVEWARLSAGALNVGAFTGTMVWWAWTAWQPSQEPAPIVSRLQPWAHSW